MKKLLIAGLAWLSIASSVMAVDFSKQLELPDFSGKAVWIARAGVGFNGAVGSRKGVQHKKWVAEDWDGQFKGVTGYDFSFGFNKSFGKGPVFWGMNLSLAMRGYKTDASWYKTADNPSIGAYNHHRRQTINSLKAYTVQLTPFTLGYRYSFLERMAAEVHLGGFVSYDFAGSFKYDYIDITDAWNTGIKYGKPSSLTTDKSQYLSGNLGDFKGHHRLDAGLNLGIGYWFGHFNIDFMWQRGFIAFDDKGDDTVEIPKKNGKPDKVKNGNLYSNSFILSLGYAF